MASVTIYKPNGDVLLHTNAKRVEHNGSILVVYVVDEMAESYGPTITTTLPYFVASKNHS